MIRIILLGRTGNNLFQYALGRVLADKHGVPLILDGSWFNQSGWSEVSHFLNLPIRARVARRWPLAVRALRKLTGKHYWEYRGVPLLRESVNDHSYADQFANAPSDCTLFGYFQSPRYFEAIASPLRAELNFLISSATGISETLRGRLCAPHSVAVHVRRRDYLILPTFQVCDSRYYLESMQRIRSCVPNARFFIFSDDPEWCRSEFREPDQEVVDSGDAAANPLHDLHLMSLANHHIIANSSYSWWAAWLGDKPGQQVLMPDRWYSKDIMAPIHEKQLPHWTVISAT